MIDDPVTGLRSGIRKTNFDLLKPYFKRHWKKWIVGVVVILISVLISFPLPLVTRFLVDKVILGKNLQWLIGTVIVLAGLKVISVILNLIEQYVFTRFQMEVSIDIQHTLLDHILQLPKKFFDEKEVGYIMTRVVSDVQGVNWFFSDTVVFIFTNILRFIGGTVLLFVLEWRLAVVVMVVLPLLAFSVNKFSKRMRVLNYHSMEQGAIVNSRFQEVLTSIPLIKAFVSEQKESNRVIDEIKTSQQISMEKTVVASVINSVISFIPDIAKVVVLVAGAYWVINDEWTLGSLLAFQSYLGYVYGPALSLANTNIQVQQTLASLDRVSALMDLTPENTPGKGIIINHLQGDVQFSNVTFSYDQTENVLEDISFHVKPGEHIAIVGPSGVGKTTLISLLLRFYLPVGGVISFDHLNASAYALDSLRQRIGYVSQMTLLMSGTIRENLRYGNQNISADEIERAVQIAGIHDFIMNLPDKYDSIVGEKGVNFSEGQKQRLSIARALLKDPDILIMDEPTSALDRIKERSIFKALPAEVKDKTMFIAAHRLSTIQESDRIFILKDKHILGTGTHQELIQSNEYYRSLFD